MEETHYEASRGLQGAPTPELLRRTVPDWDLLYFSSLPEQLKEKLTGSQSFQQTEVLAREGPEEMGSRWKARLEAPAPSKCTL